MFKDILVPIDVNDERAWHPVLAAAVTLAERFDATLHVMAVVPEFGLPMVSQYFPKDFEKTMRQSAHDELQKIMDGAIPTEIRRQLIVAEGSIYKEIVRVATEAHCDLILMGAHRPEPGDFLLGSNARKVTHHAPCSVLVLRA
jgi:nucleotide-binding universal stress UspA family protein